MKFSADVIRRAINCLYGGAIGDALGARYEFDSEDLLTKDLSNYVKEGELLPLLGEGIWGLYPGQVTDDTEMAMALANSLLVNKDLSKVDSDIARGYHNWYLSDPFDIGRATKNALSQLNQKDSNEKIAEDMRLSARLFDKKCIKDFKEPNLSNGMLMRIGPLALLCTGILTELDDLNQKTTYQLIKEIVRQDTSLTHASEEALNYSTIYVILLAFAIKDGTLKSGLDFLNEFGEPKVGDAWQRLSDGLKPNGKLAHDPTDRIGDVRIAFQLAIRKALMVESRQMSFPEALISTIKLGGDTDTNAAIVGYLCGALLPKGERVYKKWVDTLENAVRPNADPDCMNRIRRHKPNLLLGRLPELAVSLLGRGRLRA